MVKARGVVKRGGFRPGLDQAAEIKELTIAGWCPDEAAQQPMEQVHLIATIGGLENWPLVFRFKSSDTMGFIIEELIRYRRQVWPEAEALDIELNEMR